MIKRIGYIKIGNKKQLITLISLMMLVVGFIIFVLIGLNKREQVLNQNQVYGYATIVETYVGAKVKNYVRYEFKVKGKIYDGHQQYYPHREIVNIGDSCEVIYADINPEINRLVTDDNDLLKIKRTKKCKLP